MQSAVFLKLLRDDYWKIVNRGPFRATEIMTQMIILFNIIYKGFDSILPCVLFLAVTPLSEEKRTDKSNMDFCNFQA